MFTPFIIAHVVGYQAHHAAEPKVKFGKYEATLRLPDEGLFAGEETDVEFRVVDTTQKDPIEEGFKGVGAIDASATLTMPSMPGMPSAKPAVHREGVPGDYGIVLFFAHGGQFRIDLDLIIPGDGHKKIGFTVDVKDERPAHATKKAPYRMDVVDFPKNAKSGQPLTLKLRVLDTKTNTTVTSFDTAHERKFHLLVASKDLNWFRHEHPEMGPDGTWSDRLTFPAGGEYWIYGDVAPSGQGSRILIGKLKVAGPKPTWDTGPQFKPVSTDAGLEGDLSLEKRQLTVGKSITISVRLRDAKTHKPTGITDAYLGALGHLMIFSKDGQAAVHSHPVEDKAAIEMAKNGTVRFTARFPKPGYYKAYAQFNWHGKVHTLGFGLQVKP